VQEARDGVNGDRAQRDDGILGSAERGLDVVLPRDGVRFGQRLARRRIDGVERTGRLGGLPPLTRDQNGFHRHGYFPLFASWPATGFPSVMSPTVMATTSPGVSEKSWPGTMPVPVDRNVPAGKSSSR